MTDTFQLGDVVVLKSGGPQMTVSAVGESNTTGQGLVWCVWFEKSDKHSDSFPQETLKQYESDYNRHPRKTLLAFISGYFL